MLLYVHSTLYLKTMILYNLKHVLTRIHNVHIKNIKIHPAVLKIVPNKYFLLILKRHYRKFNPKDQHNYVLIKHTMEWTLVNTLHSSFIQGIGWSRPRTCTFRDAVSWLNKHREHFSVCIAVDDFWGMEIKTYLFHLLVI